MANTQEVTQKDLHDLLEIFERKSFEAGPCEEGTLVSRFCYMYLYVDFVSCVIAVAGAFLLLVVNLIETAN